MAKEPREDSGRRDAPLLARSSTAGPWTKRVRRAAVPALAYAGALRRAVREPIAGRQDAPHRLRRCGHLVRRHGWRSVARKRRHRNDGGSGKAGAPGLRAALARGERAPPDVSLPHRPRPLARSGMPSNENGTKLGAVLP